MLLIKPAVVYLVIKKNDPLVGFVLLKQTATHLPAAPEQLLSLKEPLQILA